MTPQFTGKRLEFAVTVVGDKPVRGGSLILMLPLKGKLPKVQSTKIDGVAPLITKIDDYRAGIVFDTLDPGNYFFRATFED